MVQVEYGNCSVQAIRAKPLDVNSNRKCGQSPNMRECEKENDGDRGETDMLLKQSATYLSCVLDQSVSK